MRIAAWHNLPSGGGLRAFYEHVRGLAALGHEIEVWCPPTRDGEFLAIGDFAKEHVVELDRGRQRGFRANWAGARYRRHLADLDSMERHCELCAKQINNGGFDVVFANCCQFYRASAIGSLVSAPSVLYLQEPYRWLYESLPRLPWLVRERGAAGTLRHWKRCVCDAIQVRALGEQASRERRWAAGFDRLLVNSYFSRESVLRAYGIDSRVCYLGIDTDAFTPGERPAEDIVAGVGALVPEKNIGFIIESIGRLPVPRPKLVWIGNVSSDGYLSTLKEQGESSGVCFEALVGISHDSLVNWLRRAKVFVYAPRLEPFGLAPLEANACGVPVVAVAEGGVRETVLDGQNGFLVSPDPSEFARAVQCLLEEDTLRERMGARARKMVEERWSLPQATARLESQLIELCDAGQDLESAKSPMGALCAGGAG